MTAQEWYAENMLIEGQKVYRTMDDFWVYVKQNTNGTYRITTNSPQVRSAIRVSKLEAFVTLENASIALEELASFWNLTEVQPGT